MQYVASGCSRLVLVIGADCNSRVLDPKNVRTYPLFGDAAGAVLLAPGGDRQGLVSFAVGADGSGNDLLMRRWAAPACPSPATPAPTDGSFMRMDGRPIFKWAVRILSETVRETLSDSELTLDDIDLVIFHQANQRIIDSAVRELGIDPRKVFCNLDRYGNTSSASIPLALDEAYQAGLVRRGQNLLLSGFGAGLTWATAILRW